MEKPRRNSIFELIRIIAMLFIIIYHLFMLFISPHYPVESFYKGIQIPLHIGVILFILISGYFGIRCTTKGILKLVIMVMIYYLPIMLSLDIYNYGGISKEILKDFLFLSHTPYWFIRTYICLYLFSPILNKYLTGISTKERFSIILTLSFISIYLGTSHGDPSLSDGKNLANFSLIYVLGNTLKYYRTQWELWSNKLLIPIYILLNFSLVLLFCYYNDSIISKIIWRISFPYCSPLLILNALLFFIIIAKYQLFSKPINYIASSMFAVYLIHCQPYIEKCIIGGIINKLLQSTNGTIETILIAIIFAIVIMIICIIIDKVLTLTWNMINKYYLLCKSI